jgi:hypothetical protein
MLHKHTVFRNYSVKDMTQGSWNSVIFTGGQVFNFYQYTLRGVLIKQKFCDSFVGVTEHSSPKKYHRGGRQKIEL